MFCLLPRGKSISDGIVESLTAFTRAGSGTDWDSSFLSQAQVRLWLVFTYASCLGFVYPNPAYGGVLPLDLFRRPFFTRFLTSLELSVRALKNRLTSDDFKIRIPALGRNT